MKRIEFLAPVEAMRGNLSGDQVLVYKNGKRAYEVTGTDPVTANNYDNRYIGSKRSVNGKKFFSLKGKSTTNLGSTSRLAMASFGGSCSLASNANKDLTLFPSLQAMWRQDVAVGAFPKGAGIVAWIQTQVYPMIKGKQTSVTITRGETSVTINNPWKTGGSGTDVNIPAEVLNKFQSVLGA